VALHSLIGLWKLTLSNAPVAGLPCRFDEEMWSQELESHESMNPKKKGPGSAKQRGLSKLTINNYDNTLRGVNADTEAVAKRAVDEADTALRDYPVGAGKIGI
jgi:hypothetical protein